MLEVLLRDLKHALRVFVNAPSFTLAAIAALTLGIGATTAIFSVVNAVLLKPVAFPDADRIVVFQTTSPQGVGSGGSPAKFTHWRQQSSIVQDVSAFNNGIVNLTGGSFPEQLRSGRVSADFFKLFGAPFVIGRGFAGEEDLPNGPRVAVLSQRFWETRFKGDRGVLGQTISLSGEPHTVIGVLGAFDVRELGADPQVWVPFQLDPNTRDQGHYFRVAGRLKNGVTLEQANSRMQAAAKEFREKFPDALGPNNSFAVQPIRDVLVRNVRSSLYLVAGAVGLVLLIACANVANLLLARATVRRREIALRAALGGSRARIVGQLLVESIVLALAAGVLGFFLGWAGIRALLAVNTAGLPRIGEAGALVGIDWRVLLFALVISTLTGIVFGLIPALQSARSDLTSTLKEGGGRSGTGFRQNIARSILVVVEVAMALVLLVGATLLIRTNIALASVDPGFDTKNVLTMRMSMSGPQYRESEAVERVVRTGVERLRAMPGVVGASATCCVPLQGGYGLPFVIVGRPLTDGPFHGGGGWVTVSPGYFEVFKIPVKRGRSFNDRDDSRGAPVVIINEAMAKQFWPEGNPLDDRLVIGRGVMREFAGEPERQVIGIVGDTRDGGLNADPQPMMFIPQAQVPDAANALNVSLTPLAWVVRTAVPPATMATAIQEELRQATGLPVSDVRSMSEVVSLSTSRQQFNMWLMSVFGFSALLLAAIGIYGLMSYSVEQRRQEIGIRLALGAPAGRVKKMVIAHGMALAAAGLVVGLAGGILVAMLLGRAVAGLLFRVSTLDPLAFAIVPALMGLVAFVAVWLPAARASRLDPLAALRAE
ncbi:MAG: ABC transporter permease [Vicinamibacterales bacterium]